MGEPKKCGFLNGEACKSFDDYSIFTGNDESSAEFGQLYSNYGVYILEYSASDEGLKINDQLYSSDQLYQNQELLDVFGMIENAPLFVEEKNEKAKTGRYAYVMIFPKDEADLKYLRPATKREAVQIETKYRSDKKFKSAFDKMIPEGNRFDAFCAAPPGDDSFFLCRENHAGFFAYTTPIDGYSTPAYPLSQKKLDALASALPQLINENNVLCSAKACPDGKVSEKEKKKYGDGDTGLFQFSKDYSYVKDLIAALQDQSNASALLAAGFSQGDIEAFIKYLGGQIELSKKQIAQSEEATTAQIETGKASLAGQEESNELMKWMMLFSAAGVVLGGVSTLLIAYNIYQSSRLMRRQNDAEARMQLMKPGAAYEQYATELVENYRTGKTPKPEFDVTMHDASIESLRGALVAASAKVSEGILVTGDAGVGKTIAIESLAYRISQGEFEDLKNVEIITINPDQINAGASIVGEDKLRYQSLFRDIMEREKATGKKIYIFIDEIHTIARGGVGTTSGGVALDFVEALKKAMNEGLRVIGATTTIEAALVKRDPAIDRRLKQRAELAEPQPDKMESALEARVKVYVAQHGQTYQINQIRLASGTLAAVIKLARILSNPSLPDASDSLLNKIIAEMARRGKNQSTITINPQDVWELVSREVQGKFGEQVNVPLLREIKYSQLPTREIVTIQFMNELTRPNFEMAELLADQALQSWAEGGNKQVSCGALPWHVIKEAANTANTAIENNQGAQFLEMLRARSAEASAPARANGGTRAAPPPIPPAVGSSESRLQEFRKQKFIAGMLRAGISCPDDFINESSTAEELLLKIKAYHGGKDGIEGKLKAILGQVDQEMQAGEQRRASPAGASGGNERPRSSEAAAAVANLQTIDWNSTEGQRLEQIAEFYAALEADGNPSLQLIDEYKKLAQHSRNGNAAQAMFARIKGKLNLTATYDTNFNPQAVQTALEEGTEETKQLFVTMQRLRQGNCTPGDAVAFARTNARLLTDRYPSRAAIESHISETARNLASGIMQNGTGKGNGKPPPPLPPAVKRSAPATGR